MKDRLSLQIILAMFLGIVAGQFLGSDASDLGELGKILIQLIKIIAAPLLFFTILNAILTTNLSGRQGGRMLMIATINVSLAIIIGLFLSNWIEPGKHLALEGLNNGSAAVPKVEKLQFAKVVSGIIPSSLIQPFAENSILTLIFLALLIGFGLRRISRDSSHHKAISTLEPLLAMTSRLFEILLEWIVRFTPFAVFGVVAKTFGEYGFAPMKGLAVYVAICLGGFALHILIVYNTWIRLICGRSLKEFWRAAKEPIIYGIGANSSLATLPLTLKALNKLKVSKSSSALGACVGTNFNNDGIILYEAMAALLVAQVYGINLSVGQQIIVAIVSMVAAMGVAGVPEAGFISLSLVLVTLKLPTEILPILLTVDWVIARGRTVVNVLSDMVISVALDKTAAKSQ